MPSWSKTLTDTEAQQPTDGRLVPYIRLTKADYVGDDWQRRFRDGFFPGLVWAASVFGRSHVEKSYVTFDVYVQDKPLETSVMQLTHSDDRAESNNTPCTWIHYSDSLGQFLQQNSFAEKLIRVSSRPNGTGLIEIDPSI
jgi:hypothetical protein